MFCCNGKMPWCDKQKEIYDVLTRSFLNVKMLID